MIWVFKKGDEIGTEVGYYIGCLNMWSFLMRNSPAMFSSRALKAIEQLRVLTTKYSSNIDPKNEELLEVLENIRAKFKMVCSLLGVNFKSNDSMTF